MRILYICNEYPPAPHGGIGSFTQNLASGMVKRGHQIIVFGVYPEITAKVEEVIDGVLVIRLPDSNRRGRFTFLNAYQAGNFLERIVRDQQIEIVEGPEASYGFYWSRIPKVRIIRMHGGHTFFRRTLGEKPDFARNLLERISFRNSSNLCAVSHFVANETSKLLNLQGRTIKVIPNPVDTDLFSPRPEIPAVEGRIVFVGTVCEKKGIRQLIQAMPQIVRSVPFAHLQIIGRDTVDTYTGKSYSRMLRNMLPKEVSEKIDFVGGVEHARIRNYLARASVCIYPSHMEAMPIAWLEGMSMAKPVIASQTGPGPEIIQDNYDGLLCDPYNPASIAEKIIMILQSPILQKNLGQKARKKIVSEFSLKKILQENEFFYNQVLNAKKS